MDKVDLTEDQKKAFSALITDGEVRAVYQGFAVINAELGLNIVVYMLEVMRDAEICYVPITMMTPFIDIEHGKRALNALFVGGLRALASGYEIPEQPSKGN